MKKIKIMLAAIAVLAIIGAGLAFESQKYAGKKLCTGTEPDNCPNLTRNSTTTTTGSQSFYYTHVNDDATNCNGVVQCPTQTYLKAE